MPENPETPNRPDGIEMPRPTAAPMILAVGIVLLGAGVVLGMVLSAVGAVILIAGLAIWVGDLQPGRGHVHEPLVGPERRPRAITVAPGTVAQLQADMPGYRMRLPLRVHPISAGLKGGLLGGLVMPVPALLWGLVSGHGIWYPVNLLAGMVLGGLESMSPAALEQFHASLLVLGIMIHVVMSAVAGLIYGVLLPTLPDLPKGLAWGALLAPLLWTAATFSVMAFVNPVLQRGVSWPWFIVSQFVFGVVLAVVVNAATKLRPLTAGILGGVMGGLLMAAPAVFWSLATGHGLWYPINLLASMIAPGMDQLPPERLTEFNGQWLVIASVIHLVLSVSFGVAFSLVVPRLPAIPGSLASGGLLMPLLWTGLSYGLMGLVNPLLERMVDWPWFFASQFVFGIAAALIVNRSETIPVPPAGTGPDTASMIS